MLERARFKHQILDPKSSPSDGSSIMQPWSRTAADEELLCVQQPSEGGSPSSRGKERSQEICTSSSSGKAWAASVINFPLVMQFNCLNTCCFLLMQPCSPLLLQNIVLRQQLRVWPVLSAFLCPDAEGPEACSFQRSGSHWALRTTPWDSSCVLRGQEGHILPPHLPKAAAWPEPSPRSANPTKSEGKRAVVHLSFCKLRVALCNNTHKLQCSSRQLVTFECSLIPGEDP